MSLSKRFWRKVDKAGDNECWLWNAATNGKYGIIRSSAKPFKWILAHRVAYELCIGDIPGNQWVLHKCDNPLCVNPRHLFLGSHQDNIDDMVGKGRQKKSRYSTADVDRMRDMHKCGALMRDIAAVFGCSRSNVSLLLHEITNPRGICIDRQ